MKSFMKSKELSETLKKYIMDELKKFFLLIRTK